MVCLFSMFVICQTAPLAFQNVDITTEQHILRKMFQCYYLHEQRSENAMDRMVDEVLRNCANILKTNVPYYNLNIVRNI